jgi:L-cysteine/cystine lyase
VVGVPDASLSLTTSTTNSCNIVLAGLGLGPEDEIVTTDGEHFGLLGALAASRARVRVAEARELPPDEALEVLLAEVTPRTRLVALSHVCWMSGNRFPVDELKEATGLPVREPEALAVAAPTYLSQDGYEPTGSFTARAGAPRFDSVWAPPALAGLDAALDIAPEGRFQRAAERAARCRALLAERFEVVTAPDQGTLVSFRVTGDSAEVVRRLYERGVVVRDVPPLGWIRVSCGWWTTDQELERLVGALD